MGQAAPKLIVAEVNRQETTCCQRVQDKQDDRPYLHLQQWRMKSTQRKRAHSRTRPAGTRAERRERPHVCYVQSPTPSYSVCATCSICHVGNTSNGLLDWRECCTVRTYTPWYIKQQQHCLGGHIRIRYVRRTCNANATVRSMQHPTQLAPAPTVTDSRPRAGERRCARAARARSAQDANPAF